MESEISDAVNILILFAMNFEIVKKMTKIIIIRYTYIHMQCIIEKACLDIFDSLLLLHF